MFSRRVSIVLTCCHRFNRRFLCYKQKEDRLESEDELQPVTESEKKGTVAGAVAFVIGTSIGSGILALPEKASPAVSFSRSLFYFLDLAILFGIGRN